MAGLVPAIHAFWFDAHLKDVDARDERGHDEGLQGWIAESRITLRSIRATRAFFVIARSEATKQSRLLARRWIASLRSQ
jgi:hypothetical protein